MQIHDKNDTKQGHERPKNMIARNQEISNKLNNDTLNSKFEATVSHSINDGLKTENKNNVLNDGPKSNLSNEQLTFIKNRQSNNTTQQPKVAQNNKITTLAQNSLNIQDIYGIDDNVSEGFETDSITANTNINNSNTAEIKSKKAINVQKNNDGPVIKKSMAQIKQQVARNKKISSKINRSSINNRHNNNIQTGAVRSKIATDTITTNSKKYIAEKNVNPNKIKYIKSNFAKKKMKERRLKNAKFSSNTKIKTSTSRATRVAELENKLLPKPKGKVTSGKIRRLIRRNDKIRTQKKSGISRKVVIKVNVKGNLKNIRRIKSNIKKSAIKATNRSPINIMQRAKLRNFTKKSISLIGKLIGGTGALALKISRPVVSNISQNVSNIMRNVNKEEVADTGLESLKYIYKTADDTKNVATGVKRTIKTAKNAGEKTIQTGKKVKRVVTEVKNLPKNIKRIKSAVKNAPENIRRAKTAVKNTIKTAEKTVKAAEKTVKASAKAVKAFIKNLPKAIKTALQAIKTAATYAAKAIAAVGKAIAAAIAALPEVAIVVLIVALVILVLFLITWAVTAIIGANTTTIDATTSYVANDDKTAENIVMTLYNYDNDMDEATSEKYDELVTDASSHLTEPDDYYGIKTDFNANEWIPFSNGPDLVYDYLKETGQQIDKSEFYALLFVNYQKKQNEADGNGIFELYNVQFSKEMMKGFLSTYFDISVAKQEGLTCPGKNCHIDYCSDVSGCSNKGTHPVPVFDPNTGEQIGTTTGYHCKGHPYCDNEHKRSYITYKKNNDVMDDLNFTDEEKEWVLNVEIVYDEFFLGEILGFENEGVVTSSAETESEVS